MTATQKLEAPGPKKLLALDGGGIRGALTVEVLAGIETMLRDRLGDDLVLGDYFDYIGRTSTGAIPAAALARGMSTDELRIFYEESGLVMFDKASILKRFHYKVEQETLAEKLQGFFGRDTQVIAACRRAEERGSTDPFLPDTLFGTAFRMGDTAALEDIVERVETGIRWRMGSTLNDAEDWILQRFESAYENAH